MTNDTIKHDLKRLLELHDSRELAIPRREIKRILNYHNDRTLRLMIHELRVVDGLPVFFSTDSPAGYWLPKNQEELDRGVAHFRSYIIELCKDLRDTRRAGARWLIPATQRKLL